jgi:inositol-phosphate phosphatase / L-galactose 1-phosphate phosphatase / histidinol-phosphatase
MSETCPPDLIALANRLADASGPVIRGYFRQPLHVDDKADASPVTAADREAEQAIRSILADTRPDDGIIGEEFGNTNTDAEFVWVIDPIDGTKSFITGRPIFGTLIALVRNGTPVLGLIDQPVNRERWIGAEGHEAQFNGTAIGVRDCPSLADAVAGTTAADLFDAEQAVHWQTIAGGAKHAVYGGDCYTYAQLAAGFVDVVFEAGLQTYDFCALAPVIESAGGVVTDWQGNPLTLSSDGTILACGDRRLHAEILALIDG